MKIKFEAELDTEKDDEIGLLILELLQKLKERFDALEDEMYDDDN
jgi:hypothetical protein|tara:strand:+ start:200 stop:334 length:135 start_codon:yes stop_codon:yes gene_type:complete